MRDEVVRISYFVLRLATYPASRLQGKDGGFCREPKKSKPAAGFPTEFLGTVEMRAM
ncbi:MAG: hypothetical protein GXP34_03635 [Actinobacteria bacterium]|nr:hypothetical protein [Actinomycetota bacterium]